MEISNRAFPLLLLLGCLGLASCDDACEYNESCGNNSSPANSGNDIANDTDDTADSGSPTSPPNGHLDCANLEPDQVYLHGAFDEAVAASALVEPQAPTIFCVGFERHSTPGLITESGEYIYQYEGNLYQTTPDQLQLGSEGWLYPEDTHSNDMLRVDSEVSDRNFAVNPTTGELFYVNDDDNIIYRESQPTVPYFARSDPGRLIGVLSDNSLLVFAPPDLVHVDSNLVETQITLPIISNINILSSKLFIDPDTGNQSTWLLAAQGFTGNFVDHLYRRWALDLETLTITDDGLFASLPSNTFLNGLSSGRLDGEGNFLQVTLQESQAAQAVVKRPIDSSGEVSQVIYSEQFGDRWQDEVQPFVDVHVHAELVAGP